MASVTASQRKSRSLTFGGLQSEWAPLECQPSLKQGEGDLRFTALQPVPWSETQDLEGFRKSRRPQASEWR